MMHIKSRTGFSLIEAMMAIAIIGIVLAPLFTLESTVFDSVGRYAEQFARTLFSKQFLFTASQKQAPESKKFSLEGTQERPKTVMRYTFEPVHKNSSLATLNGMYRKQVISSGTSALKVQGEAIQFVFKPERPTP